jgi:subtilisin family serine protease
VVVFTAGNNGNQTMNYPGYFHPDILDVGAIDSNGSRRYNSSYGSALDVVAPGGDIWSTIPYSSIGENHGTSMAAPHVAGVAALILSDNPNLTRQQVVNKIESTAKKVGGYSYTSTFRRPNGTWNNEMGYGLIDAYAALNSAPAISHELIRQPNSNLMTVVFSVDNPEPGVTYQWGLNKAIFSNGGNPYVALLSAFLYDGNPRLTQLEATLKCRAVRNGIYSAWSNSIRHVVQSTTPIPYTP